MIQQGMFSESSRALLTSSLASAGFENYKSFYDTVFADTFANVRWSQFFSEASPSMTSEIKQIIGSKSLPIMARIVAFDGGAPKISNDSFTVKSEDMPRFKLGMDSNEKKMEEWRRIEQMYGGTPPFEQIVKAFSRSATDVMVGMHSAITYAALQIVSTGKYLSTDTNNHGGLVGVEYDFNVPAGNKVKCGFGTTGTKYAWSSASANPLGDLLDLYKKSKKEFKPIAGFGMSQDTYDLFVAHPNVKKEVSIYATNGLSNEKFINEADINAYIVSGLRIPPITVIDDAFSLPHYDEATNSLVNSNISGFADNVVVGLPAGTFGELQWAPPVADFGDFTIEGGKFLVTEITDKKAKSTEMWMEFTGFPVPTRIDKTYYLATNEATA